MARYDQCDETCTTDCGHCKGRGRPLEHDTMLAVHAMAEVWAGADLAHSVGPNLTCREMDALVGVFLASGHVNRAVTWLIGHATGDDEPDDRHRSIHNRGDALAYIREEI
jgi:hypothetical protein